jgi:DNA-binding GntR family transcriptional regulator
MRSVWSGSTDEAAREDRGLVAPASCKGRLVYCAVIQRRNPVGYKSLKEIVYEFLVAALREGRLQPGSRIDAKEVCQSLGVSRTPVREALLQLEALGLVSFLPRQGIVVNELTERDVKELFETIGPLEAAAARLATPHLVEADFVAFERSLEVMERLVRDGDLPSLNREMEAFHQIHLARCPNQLIVSTIRLLKRRFYDVPHGLAFVREWESQLLTEHQRLVDLFRRNDAEGAAAFMQLHWAWEHNRDFAMRSYFPKSEGAETSAQTAGALEKEAR